MNMFMWGMIAGIALLLVIYAIVEYIVFRKLDKIIKEYNERN